MRENEPGFSLPAECAMLPGGCRITRIDIGEANEQIACTGAGIKIQCTGPGKGARHNRASRRPVKGTVFVGHRVDAGKIQQRNISNARGSRTARLYTEGCERRLQADLQDSRAGQQDAGHVPVAEGGCS